MGKNLSYYSYEYSFIDEPDEDRILLSQSETGKMVDNTILISKHQIPELVYHLKKIYKQYKENREE